MPTSRYILLRLAGNSHKLEEEGVCDQREVSHHNGSDAVAAALADEIWNAQADWGDRCKLEPNPGMSYEMYIEETVAALKSGKEVSYCATNPVTKEWRNFEIKKLGTLHA